MYSSASLCYEDKAPSGREGALVTASAALSSSRSSICRSWHHTVRRTGRLPRLHRAGPSASLDKSATGAIRLLPGMVPHG